MSTNTAAAVHPWDEGAQEPSHIQVMVASAMGFFMKAGFFFAKGSVIFHLF